MERHSRSTPAASSPPPAAPRRRCAGSRCSGRGCRRWPGGSRPRWGRVLLQEGHQGHQEAGRAEAALQAVGLPERLLQRMELGPAPGASPSTVVSSRPSACTASIRQERTGSPSKQDRAGAAHAVLAADVGAGQAQVVAQEVGEQQARLDLPLVGPAVDRDGDLVEAVMPHASPLRPGDGPAQGPAGEHARQVPFEVGRGVDVARRVHLVARRLVRRRGDRLVGRDLLRRPAAAPPRAPRPARSPTLR